jgi:hypothetical protein
MDRQMVAVLFRGFSTVVTVVIAVIVSAVWGDSTAGKIWAAVIIAAVIGLVEWMLIWAPKHWAVARRILDPRSVMTGVWIQDVVAVFPHGARSINEEQNRFAVFWVDYQLPDGYMVRGFAYDQHGVEYARWRSEGSPEFTRDGRSMTYRFSGTVTMDKSTRDAEHDRIGFANVDLRAGTGRVDHVAMTVSLRFDVWRVTTPWLKEVGLGQFRPSQLEEAAERKQFAAAFAQTLPLRQPTKHA